jgi:hypothetical protein
VLGGSLDRVFSNRQQMAAILDTEEGQDHYLPADRALGAALRRDLFPGPDQVLAFYPPTGRAVSQSHGLRSRHTQLSAFIPLRSRGTRWSGMK